MVVTQISTKSITNSSRKYRQGQSFLINIWNRGFRNSEYGTHTTPMRNWRMDAYLRKLNKSILHSPVNTSVVVMSVEELYLLKSVDTLLTAQNIRMHFEKCVQCCCSCLLRTNNKEGWKFMAALVEVPDFHMACIQTGILSTKRSIITVFQQGL